MSDEIVTPDDSQVVAKAPQRAFGAPELITRREGMFPDTTGFSGLVKESFLPGETPRPYGGWFDNAVDILEELIEADGLKLKRSSKRLLSTAVN